MVSKAPDEGPKAHVRRRQCNQMLAVLAGNAALGGFLAGYDISAISASMIQMQNPITSSTCPGLTFHHLDTLTQENIVSFAALGAAAGALCAGYVTEFIGRRGVLLVSSLFFAAGGLMMALAQYVSLMLVARVVTGMAIGATAHTIPCYISECSPAAVRGLMVMVMPVLNLVGQVAATAVATLVVYLELPNGWRVTLGLGVIPAGFMFTSFFLIPESPRWLLSVDRPETAKIVLQSLRHGFSDDAIEEEYQTMLEGVSEELSNRPTIPPDECTITTVWRLYVKDTHVRRALALGCALQAVAQLLGINSVMYYGAQILTMAETARPGGCFSPSHKESVAWNVLLTSGQFFGILTSWIVVDYIGRRKLFLSALVGVFVGLCSVGVAFTTTRASIAFVITSIMIYVFMFGCGISGTPWVVNSEIYPFHVRSKCMAAATVTNLVCNFIVSESFLTLATDLSSSKSDPKQHPNGIFFLYAAIAFVSFLVLYNYMPETNGVPLERARELFVSEQEQPLVSVVVHKRSSQ